MPESGPRAETIPTLRQIEGLLQPLKDQIKRLEEQVASLQEEVGRIKTRTPLEVRKP